MAGEGGQPLETLAARRLACWHHSWLLVGGKPSSRNSGSAKDPVLLWTARRAVVRRVSRSRREALSVRASRANREGAVPLSGARGWTLDVEDYYAARAKAELHGQFGARGDVPQRAGPDLRTTWIARSATFLSPHLQVRDCLCRTGGPPDGRSLAIGRCVSGRAATARHVPAA